MKSGGFSPAILFLTFISRYLSEQEPDIHVIGTEQDHQPEEKVEGSE
jgi:hypothetical protein